jgi:hypothetical protein
MQFLLDRGIGLVVFGADCKVKIFHRFYVYACSRQIKSSTGVPNGEFPKILIAKFRSRFYCTLFFSRAEDFESTEGTLKIGIQNFCWGEIVLEEKVCVGDKDLTWETPAQRGRVNRYVSLVNFFFLFLFLSFVLHWFYLSSQIALTG